MKLTISNAPLLNSDEEEKSMDIDCANSASGLKLRKRLHTAIDANRTFTSELLGDSSDDSKSERYSSSMSERVSEIQDLDGPDGGQQVRSGTKRD